MFTYIVINPIQSTLISTGVRDSMGDVIKEAEFYALYFPGYIFSFTSGAVSSTTMVEGLVGTLATV